MNNNNLIGVVSSSSSPSTSTITSSSRSSTLISIEELMFLRRSSSLMSLFSKGKEVVVEGGNEESSSLGRKLHRRSKNIKGSSSQSDLDFGCKGELNYISEVSTTTIQPEITYAHQAHSSISSSVPSLTHSRNQSSSSDFSNCTTPPLSPSTSDKFTSSPSSSKYSNSSNSPRHGAYKKRQAEEESAIDALNVYFNRLSQINEDSASRPNSIESRNSHNSRNSQTLSSLLPAHSISSRPLSSSSLLNNRPFSTSSLSNPIIRARSPSPIAEHSFSQYEDNEEDETRSQAVSDLDELSQFFSQPNSRCQSRSSDRGLPSTTSYPSSLYAKATSAPASMYSSYSSRSKRGLALQPQVLSKDVNKLKADREIPYGWI